MITLMKTPVDDLILDTIKATVRHVNRITGAGLRVMTNGRLGKKNPNSWKYSTKASVRKAAAKMGVSNQLRKPTSITKDDSERIDVYVYGRVGSRPIRLGGRQTVEEIISDGGSS